MQIGKLSFLELEYIKHLQPEGWPNIIESFRFYTCTSYCNPITIKIDNKIVGIGCSISFDKTAWLAHVIVSSEHRKQGIGSIIVKQLLNDLESKGIETFLLIATELGEPIYTKAGFKVVSEYRYFKREQTALKALVSNKIQLYDKAFYPDIIKLDQFVSRENREELIKKHLENSFVFVDNQMVRGFYLPDLGEGPIFASTIEAGTELMRFKYSKVDKACIPSENKVGIDFLHRFGFVEANTKGKRMILGKEINWKPEMIYSRIGGNFG